MFTLACHVFPGCGIRPVSRALIGGDIEVASSDLTLLWVGGNDLGRGKTGKKVPCSPGEVARMTAGLGDRALLLGARAVAVLGNVHRDDIPFQEANKVRFPCGQRMNNLFVSVLCTYIHSLPLLGLGPWIVRDLR